MKITKKLQTTSDTFESDDIIEHGSFGGNDWTESIEAEADDVITHGENDNIDMDTTDVDVPMDDNPFDDSTPIL